jgi:hypothetical protein
VEVRKDGGGRVEIRMGVDVSGGGGGGGRCW